MADGRVAAAVSPVGDRTAGRARAANAGDPHDIHDIDLTIDADTERLFARILVVDPDIGNTPEFSKELEANGWDVDVVSGLNHAYDHAVAHEPDLILLDAMLPGRRGLDFLMSLRDVSAIPVMLLSAVAGEPERVIGLQLGADDFITKPISPVELAARVDAVLRRVRRFGGDDLFASVDDGVDLVRAGPVELNSRSRQALVRGRGVNLTSLEFDLLHYFALHPGEVFDRKVLLREVWGYEIGGQATVTVHVRQLRKKIERDPSCPRLIETVHGVGYRFSPTAVAPPA